MPSALNKDFDDDTDQKRGVIAWLKEDLHIKISIENIRGRLKNVMQISTKHGLDLTFMGDKIFPVFMATQ